MSRRTRGVLVPMAALLLPARGTRKQAAETSIAAAQTIHDAIQEQPTRLAPDEAKAIEDAIAAAWSDAKARWSAATAAAQNGRWAEAVTRAVGVKANMVNLMTEMTLPIRRA